MTSGTDGPIDPANAAQVQTWDGDAGSYWAEHAERFDRSVAGQHRRLLAAAEIGVGERVLDIGCGSGQTTIDAARVATDGIAFGVDLSARMLEVARRRAADAGITNVAFERADAQIHPFEPATFDLAISRTGTMFFADPTAAFTNLCRALTARGRLAMTVWRTRDANQWMTELSHALSGGRQIPTPPPDAPGPFSMSDPSRVQTILSGAGFTSIELEAGADDMWFGDGPDDAARFLLGLMGWMLDGLDVDQRRRAVEQLHATLARHATENGVLLGSATWTIRATRAG